MKPTAYVINLDRRPERWKQAQERWVPHFELVRWSATDMPGQGAAGCKQSHLTLAEKVLVQDRMRMAIVLEDDAIPTHHFVEHGEEIIAAADAHVANWQYINMGPCLDPAFTGRSIRLLETASPFFFESIFSYRTHFVLYNAQSIPLLKAALTSPDELDLVLGRATHWVPIHLMATQPDAPSDIRKGKTVQNTAPGFVETENALVRASANLNRK